MPRKPPEFDKDEWCTPPEQLALVYAGIGVPDLDPCSNENSQVISNLAIHKEDDAFSEQCQGMWTNSRTVFANVPYSCTAKWVRKILEWVEMDWGDEGYPTDGQGREAVLLLSAETGLVWWQDELLPKIDRWIFLPRIAFIANGKPVKGNRCNSVMVYIGTRGSHIARVWWPHPVFRPCNPGRL